MKIIDAPAQIRTITVVSNRMRLAWSRPYAYNFIEYNNMIMMLNKSINQLLTVMKNKTMPFDILSKNE